MSNIDDDSGLGR